MVNSPMNNAPDTVRWTARKLSGGYLQQPFSYSEFSWENAVFLREAYKKTEGRCERPKLAEIIGQLLQ